MPWPTRSSVSYGITIASSGSGVAGGGLTPAAVWRATPPVLTALDDRFGEPLDAYVNGSQVWLRDDGPGGIAIEWRLHPVAGYQRPPDIATDELFATVALALAHDEEPPASLDRLWDGLEAFPAYGEEVEPAPLAAAVTEALGIRPDAVGLVDHRPIGDEWERTTGGTSIVEALFRQLSGGAGPAGPGGGPGAPTGS